MKLSERILCNIYKKKRLDEQYNYFVQNELMQTFIRMIWYTSHLPVTRDE